MHMGKRLAVAFKIPLIVLGGIFLYLLLEYFQLPMLALLVVFMTIALGSYQLFVETYNELLQKHFALDYLAILALVVSLITQEYLVASIIALMLTSGRTLEEYGVSQAKASLTSLIDRIPDEVTLVSEKKADVAPDRRVKISDVTVGQEIIIRRGEVIPMDGILSSDEGVIDESSLTGEPYAVEKIKGDTIRSGTLNMGNPLVIKVTRIEKDSTYHKIIDMVQNAQGEKAPMVRLADRYSTYFTIVSLLIAGFAYYISGGDLNRVLAVLVIATPCPLILATPIALLGGVNAAAKKRIIIKRLAALEALSRVNSIIFDKTGTITLGKPVVTKFEIQTTDYTEKELLSIAESIERNSLHPLAKAVVNFAKEKKAGIFHAENIQETIGKGISGEIKGNTFMLAKVTGVAGMVIGIYDQKDTLLGVFHFQDEVKKDAKDIISHLKSMGLSLSIYTGDKKEAAQAVAQSLGSDVIVKAQCTPEDKKIGIEMLKKQGRVTAMIGDGINDAPALALADVGMVFSNEEQTAASEAADIVFLGGDFSQVYTAMRISKETVRITLTSIFLGIGLAMVGMGFASVGFIPPIVGAIIQEAIDVVSIVNALRTSRIS